MAKARQNKRRPLSAPPQGSDTPAERPRQKFGAIVRDNVDALLFAVLLAMFIRIFVCELFKIPSPSMTPTLLGTQWPRQAVSYYDIDNDGDRDLLLKSDNYVHIYRKDPARYHFAGSRPMTDTQARLWVREAEPRQDRILVAKFLYWFSQPRRGDIVVFRVPQSIFEPDKPVYIKRVVGLPGETLTFTPAPNGPPGYTQTLGRLVADGRPVDSPPFFATQLYEYRALQGIHPQRRPDFVEYLQTHYGLDIQKIDVPEDGVFVLGDNTIASRDSRYWGSVDFDRLRGRALFRFWTDWGIVPVGLEFLH